MGLIHKLVIVAHRFLKIYILQDFIAFTKILANLEALSLAVLDRWKH